MQQVTVGAKYQIVIPKFIKEKIKEFKPGTKVDMYALNENTIVIKISPKSWIEKTDGFMKDAWKGIDPVKELENMRNEW